MLLEHTPGTGGKSFCRVQSLRRVLSHIPDSAVVSYTQPHNVLMNISAYLASYTWSESFLAARQFEARRMPKLDPDKA